MKKILGFILVFSIVCSSLSITSLADSGDVRPDGPMTYSYADIVGQMLDMEHAARLPLPGEKGAEFTSTDRASRYDEETDTYINWGANADWGGFVKNLGVVPGKGQAYLAAEMEGPGVIWRIWSAQADAGLIEIYIDGADEPTIAKPFNQLFTGKDSTFGYPSLNYVASQGKNCYVPITYNESCRVIFYEGWGAYYMINYTKLPDGAVVEPMPKQFSEEDRAALSRVNNFFAEELGSNPNDLSGAENYRSDYTVPAGGEVSVLDAGGQGAIAQFKVRVDDGDGGMRYNQMWEALKELTVSMYWDGAGEPDVWAPLGDFFGTPAGPASYTALPMGLDADGWLYCYFYMPFANGAKIVIGNDGEEDRLISVDAAVVPLKGNIDSYSRFHAKWNKDQHQPERADRWPDYTILDTKGSGRFMGMSLHVYKSGDTRDPNAADGAWWWGEGDEKFFVDGEKFPSSFGTGSEDYFGYAWCDPTPFKNRAHHAQTYSVGGDFGRGNRANVRYQINDNVPFFQSFEGNIEKYYRHDTEYGVVAYWYLSPEGSDDYQPVSLSGRSFHEMDPEPPDNVFEGEKMERKATGGTFMLQNMREYSPWGWSGSTQLLWVQPKMDDRLDLTFDAKVPLSGMLKISVTKSFDFGILQFYMDGEAIGNPIDTYNPYVINNSQIMLGEVNLEKGEHTFSAVVVGKNPKSSGHLLGLDCIKIDPVLPVKGVIEGEDMEVLFCDGGNPIAQEIGREFPSAGAYSNDSQLWWTVANNTANNFARNFRVGSKLILALDIEEAVDSNMMMAFTKAADYGIVQLYLNGGKLGGPMDFYGENVTRTEPVNFGRVQLEAGRHELMVEIVGKNEKAGNYMFGLDNIVFADDNMDALILGQIGNISGKKGTAFNVPVMLRSYPENASWIAMEGIIDIPDMVDVVDVIAANSIEYRSFDYHLSNGKLRYVFLNDDGKPIAIEMNGDTEIMTLKLRLNRNLEEGDSFKVAADSLIAKDADASMAFDTATAESVSIAKVISTGRLTATARELYEGDGIDLVPAGKKAVAVEFTGVEAKEDIALFGKQFYYSQEKTARTGKVTYVGLVDTDVSLQTLNDAGNYTIGAEDTANVILFGDTDGDGVLNAQDALAVVSAWLRKTQAPDEFGVLVMNVNADGRINSSDAIQIVDNYVNGAAFTVVTK